MYNMANIIKTIICYVWKLLKRVNPKKSSHHKEKFISISLILYLCEMMDIH